MSLNVRQTLNCSSVLLTSIAAKALRHKMCLHLQLISGSQTSHKQWVKMCSCEWWSRSASIIQEETLFWKRSFGMIIQHGYSKTLYFLVYSLLCSLVEPLVGRCSCWDQWGTASSPKNTFYKSNRPVILQWRSTAINWIFEVSIKILKCSMKQKIHFPTLQFVFCFFPGPTVAPCWTLNSTQV